MSQRITQKVVNAFNKGLITEAGEMTFPEGASVDELNCDLKRDGSRRRRLGVSFEDNFVDSTFSITPTFGVNTWQNVAGVAGLNFTVVQSGSTLYFYNTASEPFSEGLLASSVDLTSYESLGTIGAANARVEVTSINGYLVVVSAALDPFVVAYNVNSGTVWTIPFTIKVRDFEWQGNTDTYTYPVTPTPVNPQRSYDTANAGWSGTGGAAAKSTYSSASGGRIPPLTHPWFSGKDSNNNFSYAEFNKVYGGSSLTGNGHFVLDFFYKDRATAAGIPGSQWEDFTNGIEIESARFTTVAAFSGRVFYAGLTSNKNSGKLLYSKQLEDIKEVGKCYQQNDPTSEDYSDLLDTDGGLINIPDAMNIQRLHVLGSTLFVFAENGIWSINGVDGVFKASAYSVKRVSGVGLQNAKAFVDVEGLPIWWSKNGIHTINVDPVSGSASENNLTVMSIQSFFDAIDGNARSECVATYDSINKRVYWFYPENGESIEGKLSRVLILDVTLKAFIPWKVSDSSDGSYILGAVFYSGFGSDYVDVSVQTSTGDNVNLSTGDNVVINTLSLLAQADSAVVLLLKNGTTGKMTMGSFKSSSFYDWGDVDYQSYAEGGYDFIGEATLKKTTPYIVTYMRTTEEGFTGNDTIGYTTVRPSSMLVSAYWDFGKNPSSDAQQAYRLKTIPVVNTEDLTQWDYPEDVVTTRLKIRGSGRSMRLRFDSEPGHDFILIGYGVIQGANQRF